MVTSPKETTATVKFSLQKRMKKKNKKTDIHFVYLVYTFPFLTLSFFMFSFYFKIIEI